MTAVEGLRINYNWLRLFDPAFSVELGDPFCPRISRPRNTESTLSSLFEEESLFETEAEKNTVCNMRQVTNEKHRKSIRSVACTHFFFILLSSKEPTLFGLVRRYLAVIDDADNDLLERAPGQNKTSRWCCPAAFVLFRLLNKVENTWNSGHSGSEN